jgi:hypothetical protein
VSFKIVPAVKLIIHVYIKVACISLTVNNNDKVEQINNYELIEFKDIINSDAKNAILSDSMFQIEINRHFLTAILFIYSQLVICSKIPII